MKPFRVGAKIKLIVHGHSSRRIADGYGEVAIARHTGNSFVPKLSV